MLFVTSRLRVLIVNKKRPVNLKLTSIRLPLTAYVSILHRISGIVLLLLVGVFLYALDLSLSSEENFNRLTEFLHMGWMKFVLWLMLSVLIYHFIAGIKHLVMDAGYAEGKKSGYAGAMISLVLTVSVIALLGVWIW